MLTTKRKRIILLSIATLTVLSVIVGLKIITTARAGLLEQAVSPETQTIAYPGQLTGDNGKAVADGKYDFTFSLYDDISAGNLLWSEVQTGVVVRNGSFSILLGSANPLPDVAFSQKLWLSVSVRGAQDMGFVELTPRQMLDEASSLAPGIPSAVTGTCVHDHMFEQWIGTTTSYGLRIEDQGTGDGIRGVSASTASSYAGVFGLNTATTGQGSGVYGRSAPGYGVYGVSTSGYGIYGISTSGAGVYGTSNSNDGIRGFSSATGLSGVYGYAANGFGITGGSANSFGVQARGNDASGDDQVGDIWLDGLRGEILTGQRLNLISNWNVNVDLDYNNDGTDAAFRIYTNGSNTEIFRVDESGNMVAAGTKSARVETQDYGSRLLYAVESPEVWFEDIGSASLNDGKVDIAIEPVFAQAVNLTDYQVFLTPVSDTPVLLYVVSKTPTSFTVQGVTLDGKPAACNFDYRIVAKRLGYENVRLQQPSQSGDEVK